MAKLIAKFDTVPVNPAIDPEGGYLLRLRDRPVYDESQVFEEVVKEKTLPIDKDMLEFAFLAVLKTMALKVSRDCNPRKIGNYIKFTPTLRGKVKGMYSAYDPATCTSAIKVSSMTGLDKAIDTKYVSFVNSREGVVVTVNRICSLGEQDSEGTNTIQRGKAIIASGVNLQYIPGDSVEIHWTTSEGADALVEVVPTESDIAHMTFAWPDGLDELPSDTELRWKFRTRGGLADADVQENEKTVTLIDGEKPQMRIDAVATPGKDGIVKGSAFEATGENLSFDASAGDGVIVSWTQDGSRKQLVVTPASVTDTKLTFAPVEAFDDIPDDTELTFTFMLDGSSALKNAPLLAAE